MRFDRAGHLPHADDGRDVAGTAGLAREPGPLPVPFGQAGRVCTTRGCHFRNTHVEWRKDPPRRRDPHATQVGLEDPTIVSSAAVESNAVERDVMEYDIAIVGGG